MGTGVPGGPDSNGFITSHTLSAPHVGVAAKIPGASSAEKTGHLSIIFIHSLRTTSFSFGIFLLLLVSDTSISSD
jgi:hypothetical protein